MEGDRFVIIPDDAIGVLASENDTPLENRYSNVDMNLYNILEKSNNSIRLSAREAAGHAKDCYLGAIVSSDRSIVYWTNTSRPLP